MSRHAEDIKSRIAINLDAAMTGKEISSAELARRIGLNEKTIRRWRGGEVMPGPEHLARAAAELDRDLTSFYLPVEEAA